MLEEVRVQRAIGCGGVDVGVVRVFNSFNNDAFFGELFFDVFYNFTAGCGVDADFDGDGFSCVSH